MSVKGRSTDFRYDHELFVETAPTWQELTCPGCGWKFPEILRDGTAVRGSTCPECNDWIRYKFDRSEKEQETTEQTTLKTDGGVGGSYRCACCGDPAEPEKHNLNGPLCLDCAAAGCRTDVTTCNASMEVFYI